MVTLNGRMKRADAPVPAYVAALAAKALAAREARYAAQQAQREAQQADVPFAPVINGGASKRKIRQRNYRAK